MRPMPATLALALLGALMVALSSWGSSSPAASGVFGIVVSNPGGRIIGAYPSLLLQCCESGHAVRAVTAYGEKRRLPRALRGLHNHC